MVARIKRTQSLSRSLNYNEKKVQLGVAECIQAVNYPKDLERLNFYDKLHRLEHQAALNERVKANSVHISLNFHESDLLNKEKLCAIAEIYMKGIGFEKQPYLIYQHRDAGHPHIHIVSTNIQRDGSKIEMNNIGRNQSETARKAIEIQFGLTKAEGRGQKQETELKVNILKVQYGKTQTKKAITNVLNEVVNDYKYTSLPELNAVLKLYNVMADRGKEDTEMFQKRGLVYTALDDNGNKIGTPIKASAFYNKHTLKYLEQKFVQNEILRQAHKRKLRVDIQLVLLRGKPTLNDFIKALAAKGIDVIIRHNDKGIIYGITYIDFTSRCVFNGSDLDKEYSAKGILEQLGHQQRPEELKQNQVEPNKKRQANTGRPGKEFKQGQEQDHQKEIRQEKENVLELLLKPEQVNNYVPNQLLQKKKRKKQSEGLRV